MCGIAGIIASGAAKPEAESIVVSMVKALEHRGPDSSGIWSSSEFGVFLGHSRLAIQDITPTGHQPMISSRGNLVITFNGEIYNHLEIRTQLDIESHHQWQGTSDTETLLEAIQRWGLVDTLPRLRGMFAFAIFDSSRQTLTLVRDRFGEKPLYFGYQGSQFLFASDLASLKLHPQFSHTLDRKALSDYFRLGFVPSPLSIFRGIQKLPPGHYASLSVLGSRNKNEPELFKYWDYPNLVQHSDRRKLQASASTSELHSILQSVISEHMIADVPIGSFLSGGIDSSLVTAVAQEQTDRPLRTFTIGSPSSVLDESLSARSIAKALGTDHTEFEVTESQAFEILPLLGELYSEPFADSSQIPSVIVSKLAHSEVKVALTGDGGDEIFGGYNRYAKGLTAWNRSQRIPKFAREWFHELLESRSPESWVTLLNRVGITGPTLGVANLEDKIAKFLQVLSSQSLPSYYALLTENRPSVLLDNSHWSFGNSLLDYLDGNSNLGHARALMVVDTLTYLPDDILVKVDRASMASSLETRAPLLDARIANYAATLPLNALIRHQKGKLPLRNILGKYVPPELIERPKLGFGVPLGDWLRGPLRTWAEDILNLETIRKQGFLDATRVHSIWLTHLSKLANKEKELWTIIIFQLWLQANPKVH